MIRNLLQTFRSLYRDKFFAGLNILGLSLSFAAAVLIFIWANDELHFDDWHAKKDRIYRVLATWTFGGAQETIATTPAPLAPAALEQIPEIENFIRMYNLWGMVVKHGEDRWSLDDAYLVDTDFFDVFDYQFIQGSPSNFINPNDVVLTFSQAKKIYGTSDVVGQLLQITENNETRDFNICAVVKDPPSNSNIQFSILLPFKSNLDRFMSSGSTHWGACNFTSYALLSPGIDADYLHDKLSALAPKKESRKPLEFQLQPLKEVYLHSDHLRNDNPQGNLKTIYLFVLIGIFIIVIASINYINLTTSKAANKMKTTGIYKIVGASRFHLFNRYLGEAAFLVLLSSFVGGVIAYSLLPLFSELSGKNLSSTQLLNPSVLLILLITASLTLILSGIHPALLISKFNPLDALSGKKHGQNQKNGLLRRLLVVLQFASSTILIICTVIILIQLNFAKHEKLGYEKEHIFSFYCGTADPHLIKQELENDPSISDITISNNNIVNINSRYGGFNFEGKEEATDPSIYNISVVENFDKFFGLELLSGRWFRPRILDTTSYIINESAVQYLGFTDPIGKWLEFGGIRGTIVGVVKDFHFRSLHHPIEQLIFAQRPRWTRTVYVKSTVGQTDEAIAAAKTAFLRHSPKSVFDYSFLQERYDRLYKSESKTFKLFLLFAGLAIFISCLGIFGLTSYETYRRQKEIGIRKVLGSSVAGIVLLFSKDLMVTLCIALTIAIPISIYYMNDWLNQFSYHIGIEWWLLAICAIGTVFIALITSNIQGLRAALNNPIDSLRNE